MKRLFTAFALLTAIAFFSACKKTEVTQVVNNAITYNGTIQPGDWKVNTTGTPNTNWQASYNLTDIDANVADHGAVLIYLNYDGKGQSWDLVPETINGYVYTGFHGQGFFGVEISAQDGGTLNAPTVAIPVKVTVIKSDAGN